MNRLMGFIDKLEEMKNAIINEADGVTCEECEYARFDCGDVGYCSKPGNTHVFHGGAITISRWAPRCKTGFEEKIGDSL